MLKKIVNFSLFLLGVAIFVVPLTTWAEWDDPNSIDFGSSDSTRGAYGNNIYAPPSLFHRQLSDSNINIASSFVAITRRKMLFKETASIDTSILFGMSVGGNKWRSRYTEFEQPQDLTLTEKKYFNIRIKGYGPMEGTKGFIQVQLLDENTGEQEYPPNGTYTQAIELPMDEFGTISIPLDKFKEDGADLSCIKRVAIHYGEETWRIPLNEGGAANISIDKGWFSETLQGEEPKKPSTSKNDENKFGCFISNSLAAAAMPLTEDESPIKTNTSTNVSFEKDSGDSSIEITGSINSDSPNYEDVKKATMMLFYLSLKYDNAIISEKKKIAYEDVEREDVERIERFLGNFSVSYEPDETHPQRFINYTIRYQEDGKEELLFSRNSGKEEIQAPAEYPQGYKVSYIRDNADESNPTIKVNFTTPDGTFQIRQEGKWGNHKYFLKVLKSNTSQQDTDSSIRPPIEEYDPNDINEAPGKQNNLFIEELERDPNDKNVPERPRKLFKLLKSLQNHYYPQPKGSVSAESIEITGVIDSNSPSYDDVADAALMLFYVGSGYLGDSLVYEEEDNKDIEKFLENFTVGHKDVSLPWPATKPGIEYTICYQEKKEKGISLIYNSRKDEIQAPEKYPQGYKISYSLDNTDKSNPTIKVIFTTPDGTFQMRREGSSWKNRKYFLKVLKSNMSPQDTDSSIRPSIEEYDPNDVNEALKKQNHFLDLLEKDPNDTGVPAELRQFYKLFKSRKEYNRPQYLL